MQPARRADRSYPLVALPSPTNTDRLSHLIGEIYDVVLQPESWSGVLRLCSEFLPGHAAALFAKGVNGRGGHVYYHDDGIDAAHRQSYFDEYANLDPLSAMQYFSETGNPVSTTDCLPYPEFVQTRFYKEWVQPQGIVDFINVKLESSQADAAHFGIFRHERHGLVTEETRWRMRLLAPHIRRAVSISRLVEHRRLEAATLADTLDTMSAAMIMVDGTGKVAHANAAGQAMIAERDMLDVMSGRLVVTSKAVNRALFDALEAATQGDDAIGTRGVALSMTSRSGSHFVAHVLPLTSGTRKRAGREYSASSAIFVRKAELEPPSAPRMIAELYGLTPSELRVLLAVFDTGSIEDIAAALGISVPTVKTHLRRLFDKTGTRRQTDLVKLASGYAAANA